MKTPLEVLKLYAEHDYTLLGAFASRMRRDPHRPFMLFEGRTWSWEAFYDAMLRCRGRSAACLMTMDVMCPLTRSAS